MTDLKEISRGNIKGILLLNGLKLSAFARKHGFRYRSVQTVINRYYGKKKRRPRGTVTLEILNALAFYYNNTFIIKKTEHE